MMDIFKICNAFLCSVKEFMLVKLLENLKFKWTFCYAFFLSHNCKDYMWTVKNTQIHKSATVGTSVQHYSKSTGHYQSTYCTVYLTRLKILKLLVQWFHPNIVVWILNLKIWVIM